jgi:hypothetical protein
MQTSWNSEQNRERDHLEDLGADGRIMLKLIFKELGWGIDCIGLAQESERLRAFVNVEINLRVA